MNEMHKANVKKLLLKTLERRHACTETELSQIPEIKEQAGDNFQLVLSELVADKQVIFMEFAHEDLPGTIRTIYFPVGTIIYEPCLSVKGRFLPDDVETFYERLLSKNILEKELFDGLDYSGKMKYYLAMQKHCREQNLSFRKLDRSSIYKILQDLVSTRQLRLSDESQDYFGGS